MQGKTIFQQKKECCAGALEGRFLKMLVAATGAHCCCQSTSTSTEPLQAYWIRADPSFAVRAMGYFWKSLRAV